MFRSGCRRHVHAGKRYGLPALAAVIEQKVQEAGGTVGEEEVEDMAERIRRSLHAAEAREMRRNSDEGIQAAFRERKAIDERLEEVVARLEPTPEGFKAEDGSIKGEKVEGAYRVAAGNLLGDPAIFFRRGDNLDVILCHGGRSDYDRLANVRELDRYRLELTEGDTWRWLDDNGRYYTSTELADEALRRLLREYEERRKADIARRRR